jgi:mono/diheme cytochrome c family protein
MARSTAMIMPFRILPASAVVLFCGLCMAVAMMALWGCGSARRGAPGVVQLPDSPEFMQGQAIFMMHCNHCHPGGTAGLGPALNNKPLPRWFIGFQVRKGLGAMPAFSKKKISDDQLEQLTFYLIRLRQLPKG